MIAHISATEEILKQTITVEELLAFALGVVLGLALLGVVALIVRS